MTEKAHLEAPRAWTTIVGVVPSIRQHAVPRPGPVAYLPIHAATPITATVMVRSGLDPASVATFVRDQARTIDPNVPLYRLRTLATAVVDATWNARVSEYLALSVTILCLVLAMVGLSSVTAHRVSLRTREIGVRMALGARPFQLIALVLSGVRVPLVLGLLLGVAGALAWDRAFASRLANNYLANPRALLILASLMASVVVLACFFPVRKATRMNPVVALRHE